MRELTGTRVANAGMLALAVAMGIGRFAFTPLLPMMQDDYALPVAMGTWLATANYAGYLAGALMAMAMRVTPAAAICGSLLAIAGVTLGMGLTESFAAWLALRAIAGIASAWTMIYVSSWCLQRLAALHAPQLSGRIYAGVGLGIAAAGLMSLVMMTAHWGAAGAWIALGAVALFVLMLAGPVFVEGRAAPAPPVPHAKSTELVWDGETARIVICFASAGFGYIVPATFLPAMAKAVMHEPSVFGWSWPVFGAAALASTLFAAALRRRAGNRQLWIGSQLVMAVGVALPALSGSMTAIILSGLLVGGTFMVITMAAVQEGKDLAGSRAVGLLSALTAAFAIGQILGPLSVNVLIAAGGTIASALLLASGVLMAGAYLLYRSPQPLRAASVGNALIQKEPQ